MSNHHNAAPCYAAGARAKRLGFARVSPYYEKPRADYWWQAGFDGIDFLEAEKNQPEFSPGTITNADLSSHMEAKG
jgi:hypothetical protein